MDSADPNLVTEWSWRDPKIEQRRKTNVDSSSQIDPKAPRGSVQLRTPGGDDDADAHGRSRAASSAFLTQEQIDAVLAMRDNQHKDPHNVGSHLNLAVAVTSALMQMHHRASRQSVFARKYMRKREIEEEGPKGILKRSKELLDRKSLGGFDSRKPHQIITPLKRDAVLEYAIPPDTLEAGAARDDEYVIDWKGSVMDVPINFYKTTVKKELCTQDDLNEIFTEKFALNDRTEYFGRTLVIVSYVYMIFSTIVLVTTSGLYFTPSEIQMLVTLNSERSTLSLYALFFCGTLSLLSSITIYVVLLQNYRRIIPYILHVMVLISILFLALACWTKKEWKSPSSRDYVSFFVASAMRDVDPNFLQDVWPNVDPNTFSSIQKTFFCCGIKSSDDWFNLDRFHKKPTIDPSCCINTTIDGVPTKCTQLMEEWKEDPTNTIKLKKMKAWINEKPCEEILIKQNEYYNWDMKMYPMIFCVVHTCLLSIASYLLQTYIREVNTWDGEVRMNLYRQNHKNYWVYLFRLWRFKVRQVICTCCNYRVYPERPPRYILGETTHFEVWHTASGDIVNVIEVPLDQEKELKRQQQNELGGFMDENHGIAATGQGRKSETNEKIYSNFKQPMPRKNLKKKDTREQLKALDWMDFDIGPYFASEKGLLQSFLHEGDEEV